MSEFLSRRSARAHEHLISWGTENNYLSDGLSLLKTCRACVVIYSLFMPVAPFLLHFKLAQSSPCAHYGAWWRGAFIAVGLVTDAVVNKNKVRSYWMHTDTYSAVNTCSVCACICSYCCCLYYFPKRNLLDFEWLHTSIWILRACAAPMKTFHGLNALKKAAQRQKCLVFVLQFKV